MNWKLLLIALSATFVVISARPADETKPIEITQPPTTATAAATTREEKPTTFTSKTDTTTTSATSPTSIRYLHLAKRMPTKPTNSKLRYSNNYANLITKYTLMKFNNNNNNNHRNVSSDNSNKNMYVTLHGVVVGGSLPLAESVKTTTETSSNSSSRPIVFIANDGSYETTQKSTTKREYPPLKLNVMRPAWPNLASNEADLITTIRPNNGYYKKPVIHKILSKWSDDPQDVFAGTKEKYENKYHNDFPVFSTRLPKPNPMLDVEDLKNNLYQNVILPEMITSSSFNGLSQMGHDLIINPFATPTKVTPTKSSSTKKPLGDSKSNCRKTKIKVGNKISNQIIATSKENCDEIELQIENTLKNTNAVTEASLEDYSLDNNDKFMDTISLLDESSEKTENAVLSEDLPQVINSITEIRQPLGASTKKHKKKKPQNQNQIDYEDGDSPTMIPDTSDSGSMMMTMMTMMAIFNPLNFGVWGIVIAPFAAVLLGGVAYGMWYVMHNGYPKSVISHPPAHHGWSDYNKKHEILVKNKIIHGPLPIKVVHKHIKVHAHQPPPKIIYSEPHHVPYDPPMMAYGPPMMAYGPPPEVIMTAHTSPSYYKSSPKLKHKPEPFSLPSHKHKNNHFAEPPVDDYYPSAPSGGPYKRKSNHRHRKYTKPTKFKLL